MTILVTGGAGYIGSHTALVLLEQGHDIVVLDNLVNANAESLRRVEALSGRSFPFVKGDIRDRDLLDKLFGEYAVSAVIHFAALKAVGESTTIPLVYHDNNVYGTICLLQAMERHGVSRFIFSSSATIYGEENDIPYVETMKPGTPASAYGATKLMVERVLHDVAGANSAFQGVTLRYFNPIGAHESGRIGEAPDGIPNNLLPYVAQVAVGKRDRLSIFGNDYATADGSCERDYLHVMDLAEGHMAALDWLHAQADFRGVEAFNLGTGSPVSVFGIVKAFEGETGITVPYDIAPRRAGDLPAFWANADKAADVLGWRARRSLEDMMQDTWRWQSQNPNGFE